MSSCLLCAAPHSRDLPLCQACLADLPWLRTACPRCAMPGDAASLCGHCLTAPPPFDLAIAPFLYRFPVDIMVRRFKFQRRLWWVRILGECLAARGVLLPRPACLVPVPLHWRRRCTRGYNQALEIARVAGAALDLPVDYRLIRRVRAGPRQAQLSGDQRRRNLRGAFQLTRESRMRSIAIVDDVMTTGTTAGEIARLLKRSGVKEVQVWTAARAI